MESHYCRANTSKLYLEPIWLNKQALNKFYCEDFCVFNQTTPMSKPVFVMSLENKNIFIFLFTSKIDACDICTAYETGNLSLEKKEVHDQMKQEARLEKENDKLSMDEVFTMDLQSVLLCPKSFVSSLNYKTKLIVHNFTLYDLKRKIGYCFLWNETEGGLRANAFSSIIVYFLQKYVIDIAQEQKVKIILLVTGQNIFEIISLVKISCGKISYGKYVFSQNIF
ncbi:unnamed protein product [Macrosiphum euphorbiae]|uniref:Ornithine decarboxylase antizyme n=1 Tax=Macrosiphum euphorbiae TaxID=13131 RepID=A0AAV0WJ16_9HEMI|nr:unnamed protein product [Macrosiphum euphorbiae]